MPYDAPSAYGEPVARRFMESRVQTSTNNLPSEYCSVEQSLVSIRKLLEELVEVLRSK